MSILSAFLLTNGDEMYCHSLITMKATLEDLEPPTFTAKDLRMLTFVTSSKLGTKKPRVWVSGLLLHMPRTPRHYLLPSPKPKSMPLSNAFRRASPLPSHATLVTFAERQDIGLTNVWTTVALQQSLMTKPNGHSSEASRCPGHRNSCGSHGHCQEGQGEQQANKQSWKYILLTGTESTNLVNGCTFHWCSKCMLPQWSTTHLTVTHTDYSTTSKQNTNTPLLDVDTSAWVIDIPVQDMKLAFSKSSSACQGFNILASLPTQVQHSPNPTCHQQ